MDTMKKGPFLQCRICNDVSRCLLFYSVKFVKFYLSGFTFITLVIIVFPRLARPVDQNDTGDTA